MSKLDNDFFKIFLNKASSLATMAIISLFFASLITYIDLKTDFATQLFSYWHVYGVNFFFSLFSLIIISKYQKTMHYLPKWAIPRYIASSRFNNRYIVSINIIMLLCSISAVKYLLMVTTSLLYMNVVQSLIIGSLALTAGPLLLLLIVLIGYKLFTVLLPYKTQLQTMFGTGLMLFSSSNGSSSELDNNYAYLSSNTVASQNYEIIKLYSSGINHEVLFDSSNKTYIITIGDTDDAKYLKINELGYIVDSYIHHSRLHISGVFFSEDSFVDWAITGNKFKQHYSEIINADKLSEADFIAYFNKAQQLDFSIDYDESEVHCYLKIDNKWLVLETKNRFDKFEQDYSKDYFQHTSKTYLRNIDPNNKLHLVKNKIKPFQKWGDENNKIVIKEFNKKGYKRAPFLDFNNTGWQGDYGDGYFDIKHHGELLHFKAFTVYRSGFNYSPGVRLYSFPKKINNNPETQLIFMGRNTNKSKREELGLYVLRKKIEINSDAITKFEQQGISFGQYLFAKSQLDWTISFEGFDGKETDKSKLDSIVFNDGAQENTNQLFSSSLASKLRLMPSKINMIWSGSNISDESYYIRFNNDYYRVEKETQEISFGFELNETIMLELFQKLALNTEQNTEKNIPINLKVKLQTVDDSHGILSLTMSNKVDSLVVDNVRLIGFRGLAREQEDIAVKYYDQAKIKAVFELAMNDTNASTLQEFIDQTTLIAKQSDFIDDYSFQLADHSTKLIIQLSKQRQISLAVKIINHYINTLLPATGRDNKTDDVASNALVICIIQKDQSLCNRIFDKLLPDLNVEKIQNEVLLFNLACYYSLNNKKQEMLDTIKRAIVRGKKPQQFQADTDFKAYWNDPDFLSILSESK